MTKNAIIGWYLITGHGNSFHPGPEPPQCALPEAWKPAYGPPESPAELGGVEAVAWMIDAEFVDAGKVRTFSATKPNPDMWGKATFTPLYASTPTRRRGCDGGDGG